MKWNSLIDTIRRSPLGLLQNVLSPLALLAPLLLLAACASNSINGGTGDDDDGWNDEPGATNDDDGSEQTPTAPPEVEDDFLGVRPMNTEVYVFVANPARDTVSKFHAETRDIQTIPVGREPIAVEVDELYVRAVTFNKGSDSVSVIDIESNAVTELKVRDDFNRIVMSPDGRWVIAYFDAALADADFGVQGVRSFTEISVVDLVNLEVESFSVGFNPGMVLYTQDSDRAVLSSDQYIGVVDLTVEPIRILQHFLEVDLDDPPVTGEVLLNPAGTKAFVRKMGLDQLQLVDLQSGHLDYLDGGLQPSDLDITPDGLQAILVSRGSNEIRLFSTTDPMSVTPTVLALPGGETIGSVVLSSDGSKGLLYTTSTSTDHITFWNRSNNSMLVRNVVKPVQAVSLAPDGRSALIVHQRTDVPGENDYWTSRWAISIVSVDSWIVNPVATESKPIAWSNSVDGRYSTFIMENSLHAGIIDFNTRLVDDIVVPSQPVFVGIMPLQTAPENALAWISQEHHLGRISFVRLQTLAVETITGFELNSQID